MKCKDVDVGICAGLPYKGCGTVKWDDECPHYKEPKMSEKIAVHVPNRYLWEAVEKNEIAVRGKCWSNGFLEKEFPVGNIDSIVGCIAISDSVLWWGARETMYYRGYEIIPVDEYFKRFGEKPESPIKIGQYEVKDIDKDGFSVGCQRVTWDVFDKIAAKRPKDGA